MCNFSITVGSHLFFSEICLTHETTHVILDCAKIMDKNIRLMLNRLLAVLINYDILKGR